MAAALGESTRGSSAARLRSPAKRALRDFRCVGVVVDVDCDVADVAAARLASIVCGHAWPCVDVTTRCDQP